ncbi:MAG: glutaminase domain-containing protein [Planctomycetota bacterium]
MQVISDCAATLGSRFNLIFSPADNTLYQNAFGEFREQALSLVAGIRTPDGRVLSLPFTDEAAVFSHLEHDNTITSLTYRGVEPELAAEVELTVRAPFYPRQQRLSTAPVYYVDLTVRRVHRWRGSSPAKPLQSGVLLFDLGGDGIRFGEAEDGFSYRFISTSERERGPDGEGEGRRSFPVDCTVRCRNGDVEGPGRIALPFDFGGQDEASLDMLWTCWVEESALEVKGESSSFKYREFFSSEDKLASWSWKNAEEIEPQCDFVDSLFEDWSLGRATSNMSALAMHSYLANTWWTRHRDGEWFSVWEGNRYNHSSVDVEYNVAVAYLALWPELLDMQLREWAECEEDGQEKYGGDWKDTAFLRHDMGKNYVIGEQGYPHDMEVEANADYLLMLAARTFFTGELSLAKELLPLCRRLAEFIIASDTTGSGFPDTGTANTVDDACPALQYGREQTYLAVKAQAALWALAELEDEVCEDEGDAERWKAFTAKSVKKLNEKAWVKDHFALTLDRTTRGLVDPWSGDELPEGELEGWDDCSIYTSNGLLYLFMANIKMPRWNRGRLARDIATAEERTRSRYGNSHTGRSDETVWFSQNLWRDYVAAYLEMDMLNNAERCWDYQLLMGCQPDAALYQDSTPQNDLSFHPRGATVVGASMAAAGLKLNRVDGELLLCPVKGTLRVPLLPLVDWENMKAPWLTVRTREGVATARIENEDLAGKLTVMVSGAEIDETGMES